MLSLLPLFIHKHQPTKNLTLKMKRNLESIRSAWTVLLYVYFIGLAAYWFYGEISARQNFSYFALGVMLFLAIQAVIQNRVIGVSLGMLVIAVSALFFLAVISEFSDFVIIIS